MRRHYISLWALLAVAFVVFTALSAFEMPYLGSRQLKSSGLADALLAGAHAQDKCVPEPGEVSVCDSAAATVLAFPPDTTAHTILLIGDSMLEGIAPRLAAYADYNGHILYAVMWYSSTTERWGRSDRLKAYIRRLRPTYVVVCLGSNELFVDDVEKKRDRYVKKILADLDTIPYIWIGPPNWRSDTGINRLIQRNTGSGHFFLSDGLVLERSADGAHPTRPAAAVWLDSVLRWMPENALHPIRMRVPDKDASKPRRMYVHMPDER